MRPRSIPPSRLRCVLTIVISMMVALTGCGSTPDSPEGVTVPGTEATVTVPASWAWSVQGSAVPELILRDREATGNPATRSTIILSSRSTTQTLAEESSAAIEAIAQLPGWSIIEPAEVTTGSHGYAEWSITGSLTTPVAVTQTHRIIEVIGDDPKFIYITTTMPTSDPLHTEKTIASILDSVSIPEHD